MAATTIFVDPSIAGDSGTGTIGDPFGDIKYAIDSTAWSTEGVFIHVKAGTDEVLTEALNTTMTANSYVPTETAPLVFRGYTSAANDGGVGGISGGGSFGICLGDAFNYVSFVDLHLHNTGSAEIISLNDFVKVIRCELDNTTDNAIDLDLNAVISGCYIHNVGGNGATCVTGVIENCYLENGTNDFTLALYPQNSVVVSRNIVSVDGTTVGIFSGEGSFVCQNSVYSAGGTGAGIRAQASAHQLAICNNVVEGFSGAGGVGIDLDESAFVSVGKYDGNAVYNCTTAYSDPTRYFVDGDTDNETLTASPFTDAANGDFSPVDTGNVKEGSLPQIIGGGLV